VPDVPETPHAAEPTPVTRRERRAASAPARRPPTTSLRPLAIGSTMAFSGLIALTGYSYSVLVALAVGLIGLVLAWGWPVLLALPSPRGTTTVLAIGAVSCVAAAALMRQEPFLEWIPAALAVSLVAAFLHQLLRRDGRPRLTESVAATGAGLAILSIGVAYIPLPRTLGGEQTLAAAMAALAVSAVADLALGSRRLRPWALPIAMVLGGVAAAVVSILDGRPMPAPAALIGLLIAGIAHATRRIMAVLPSMASARSQLTSGAASVLVCGVVAYTLGRILVA
jgi:hypothetical protein